jgi:two-component system, sensor histidine kinase
MQHAGPAKRILVIEDDVDAADTRALLLGLLGHRAVVARSGHAGLAAALATRPAVIVLDLGMPGLGGYEVAARLRARGDFEDVLIIAVTGYGLESDRDHSAAVGIDHHLVKPCISDDLVKLLGDGPTAASANSRGSPAAPRATPRSPS